MWTAIGLVLSRSGATVEKVWRGNPAVKWAVLVLVGLLALDLVARESIALWKDLGTVQTTIDATNAENMKQITRAQVDACAGVSSTIAGPDNCTLGQQYKTGIVQNSLSPLAFWCIFIGGVMIAVSLCGFALVKLRERRNLAGRRATEGQHR